MSTVLSRGRSFCTFLPSPSSTMTALAQVASVLRVNERTTGWSFLTAMRSGVKPLPVTAISTRFAVGADVVGAAGAGTGLAGAGLATAMVPPMSVARISEKNVVRVVIGVLLG